MTATLEATGPAADAPEPPPSDPDRSRPVPPALRPWRDSRPGVGWLVTLGVALLAGLTRFWALGFPPGANTVPKNGMNFDEVYYAVEAQEILRFGYEDNRGYMFIVHPPLGKWLIAASEWLTGSNSHDYLTNSLGWRLAPAAVGTLGVVLVARIARRMFRSNVLGAVAGALMAMEGSRWCWPAPRSSTSSCSSSSSPGSAPWWSTGTGCGPGSGRCWPKAPT